MKLWFGKHIGRDIADPEVPTTYLTWVEERVDLTVPQRKIINEEIARRNSDRPGAGRVVREGK